MFPKILKKQSTLNPVWALMNSQCYDLALELRQYLLSGFLLEQFPIFSLPDYHENALALHVCLLNQRMLNENTRGAKRDAEQFNFACKTYLFADFANTYNQDYPPDSFTDYFIENYSNRVNILTPEIMTLDHDIQTLDNSESTMNAQRSLRKFIFLNKIDPKNQILQKFTLYYLAHRNYLQTLRYEDLMQYKIYWGLESKKFIN